MEHVNDLSANFFDVYEVLREGGVAVYEVDFKSHGLHRINPLNFLAWPTNLWSWMYTYKGVSNWLCVNRFGYYWFRHNFNAVYLLAEEQDIKSV